MNSFLAHLLNQGNLPAFLTGMIAAAAVGLPLARFVGRWRAGGLVRELRSQAEAARSGAAAAEGLARERDALRDQVALLRGGVEAHKERAAAVSDDCERLTEKVGHLERSLKAERARTRKLGDEARTYADQLDGIASSDGKIWLSPVAADAAAFLPLNFRKAPVISLMNLKGGVGKTTLTANLAAVFAGRGSRVLLIDLDHQSSLSNMCLLPAERKEVERAGVAIDRVFAEDAGLDGLNRNAVRLQSPEFESRLYLAPSREDLADIENQLMTRWHAGLDRRDVRFLLRRALHDQGLRDHYDLVLIDCPPRLTTACVNALAASDYLLVPVLLQDTSVDAVPRLLAWLRQFQVGCCNHLDLLGIVGNRAYARRTDLIAREQVIWTKLGESLRQTWNGPVRMFDEVIREHANHDGRFAALDARHRPRYERLADQIASEIPHARLQSAAVPATPGAHARRDRA